MTRKAKRCRVWTVKKRTVKNIIMPPSFGGGHNYILNTSASTKLCLRPFGRRLNFVLGGTWCTNLDKKKSLWGWEKATRSRIKRRLKAACCK
jgi:hypothetical protein